MLDYTLLFFYIVFQRNRGLVQDGVVGSNTWDWLLKGTKM
nr:MAG TPA: GIL01 gp7, d-transpeptidase, TRANSFERASE, transferase-transferase inhibitor [Caudoviricetes sp.]